ncbi:hypothetical protein BLNAU_15929 [Blattamonas nauphoetae]|uniref:Uncharacterized protein n=1 Tax=Blattamonas nauphoetae TaxID=2049346 RepID=A0ABQ9X936_9EUKA|nr:hypothetical protein BLNAU_15929 [Blattamonas nauphoetae]
MSAEGWGLSFRGMEALEQRIDKINAIMSLETDISSDSDMLQTIRELNDAINGKTTQKEKEFIELYERLRLVHDSSQKPSDQFDVIASFLSQGRYIESVCSVAQSIQENLPILDDKSFPAILSRESEVYNALNQHVCTQGIFDEVLSNAQQSLRDYHHVISNINSFLIDTDAP